MAQLSVSEARSTLPEVLDRVAAGEEITITRHGRPVAVLLRPDSIRPRRAEDTIERARELGGLLAAAREQPLGAADLSVDRAEELVEAVRIGRDRS
ncbi:MAG: type II toxin-antitoxin system Phd/YefM family antitoxin [Pseudonocardia sp.]